MNETNSVAIAFEKLGQLITIYCAKVIKGETTFYDDPILKLLDDSVRVAQTRNEWFTKENILFALKNIAISISQDSIDEFVSKYNFSKPKYKSVGVIMAGNIPIVGFNDFFYVLMSGSSIKIKLSSKDDLLLAVLAQLLINIEPKLESKISFEEFTINDFDAIIATGSSNSSNLFKEYFGKYPNIIRSHRSSIAVISNEDSKIDLELLGRDIFSYFGLGCRNVSKIFIPKEFDLSKLFESIISYSKVMEHNKYMNNFDYNSTLYLMKNEKFLVNNFLILKESEEIYSPISVLNYSYYNNLEEVEEYINLNKEKIQIVLSNKAKVNKSILFGNSQMPTLLDYADDIDVMDFLLAN